MVTLFVSAPLEAQSTVKLEVSLSADSAEPPVETELVPAAFGPPTPLFVSDTVRFAGITPGTSLQDVFEFQVENGIHLSVSPRLHRILLRQELFRRLGYETSAARYLPKITVVFPDADTRDLFLAALADATGKNSAKRWIASQDTLSHFHPGNAPDGLRVTLQDVALGSLMTVRNAAEPAFAAGWIGDGDSPNLSSWTFGDVHGAKFSFTLPDGPDKKPSISLSQALAALEKIAALSRDDIEQASAAAGYPDAVAKLAAEKLIARRNSALETFHSHLPTDFSPAALTVDENLSIPPGVSDGQVTQKIWQGYASSFSEGGATSLWDIWHYPVSLVADNDINELLYKANASLPTNSIVQLVASHQADYVDAAINAFTSGGEVQAMRLGGWMAPVFGGSFDLSRDLVIGNTMGTNSLITLVDTYGIHANAGIMFGLNTLYAPLSARTQLDGEIGISFAHLKPLPLNQDSLAGAVQEPLQNYIAAILFQRSSKIFQDIAHSGEMKTPEQMKKDLQADMGALAQYIGVGESLIIEISVQGNRALTLEARAGGEAAIVGPAATLTGGQRNLTIWRARILRQSEKTMRVFADDGTLAGLSLSLQIGLDNGIASLPILTISGENQTGTTKSRIFTLDINPNPAQNPELVKNALALSSLLKNGSLGDVESLQAPAVVTTGYDDFLTNFQLMFIKDRSLQQQGKIHIQIPSGYPWGDGRPKLAKPLVEDFVSLGDGEQYGMDFDAFFSQLGSAIIQRLTGNPDQNLSINTTPDPGFTDWGSSTTRNATFQGHLLPNGAGLDESMVQIERRYEGSEGSAGDIQDIANRLGKKYGFKLFNDHFLGSVQNLQAYTLSLKISLYDAGIRAILNQDKSMMLKLLDAYRRIDMCDGASATSSNYHECGSIQKFRTAFLHYKEGIIKNPMDPMDLAQTMLKAISGLEGFLDFNDIVLLLDNPNQIYVSATLTAIGDQKAHPWISIHSNVFGKPDPSNPDGVVKTIESFLGIEDGELASQWIRSWM